MARAVTQSLPVAALVLLCLAGLVRADEDVTRLVTHSELKQLEWHFSSELGRITEEFRSRLSKLEAENAKLKRDAGPIPEKPRAVRSNTREHVDTDAAGGVPPPHPVHEERRLSGSPPTVVPVAGWSVHEFPTSSCVNTPGLATLRPLDTDGSITWKASPYIASEPEFAFGSVSNTWAFSEIAKFPSPVTVVHDDATCAASSLRLGMNTTVAGSLSVNGNQVLTAGSQWIMPTQWDPAAGASTLAGGGTTSVDSNGHATGHILISDLTRTIELDVDRTVLISYRMNWEMYTGSATETWLYMITTLWIDSVEYPEARTMTGSYSATQYGNNCALWIGKLGAGSHTIQVKYRSGYDAAFTANSDFIMRTIQVVTL